MYENITVEEAMALVMECCPPLPPEESDPAQAVGRPLCADAVGRRELPPFDRAGSTGYAVRASDLHRANHKRPVFLKVVDQVPVGRNAAVPVGPEQAVRLDRGAPLPAGCDCVVPLEDTDGGAETVAVFCQLWPFDNIQRQGMLTAAGQTLCAAGQAPDAALTALLRAAGVQKVLLRPLARLGVLTVGSQLSPAGVNTLLPAHIPDFSQLYLTECWRDRVEGVLGQTCLNRPEAVTAACKLLLPTGPSLLLTAGGEAAVRQALPDLGADGVFRGLKLRGQSHTAAYRYRQTLILSLPGDPFFAGVAARLLVPAALGALGEDPSLLPQRKRVKLLDPLERSRPQRRFLPARLRDGGALLLSPEEESVLSLCGMEALVDIPEGVRPYPGESVTALILPR